MARRDKRRRGGDGGSSAVVFSLSVAGGGPGQEVVITEGDEVLYRESSGRGNPSMRPVEATARDVAEFLGQVEALNLTPPPGLASRQGRCWHMALHTAERWLVASGSVADDPRWPELSRLASHLVGEPVR